MSDFNYINDLIKSKFPQIPFKIEPSSNGMTGRTYIASSSDEKYFVKLDVNSSFLRRLEEIGLIPSIIFAGDYKNRACLIQKYLDGETPNRCWFKDHLNLLAKIVKTYHGDQKLFKMLAQGEKISNKDRILGEVRLLERKMTLLSDRNKQLRTSFDAFLVQAHQINGFDLVPVHPDPNRKNFLVSKNRLYIIDWDRPTLSDELRDIGPLLWWYIPETVWPQFFTLYGVKDKDNARRGLYWWAARQSLEIAIWFMEHKKDEVSAKEYTADFIAAVDCKPNPKSTE